MDDLDLVAAVRAGDEHAFETLFLRYQPRIAAYVGGMVRDHGRAEDITQEVFMSALRRLRDDDVREIHFRPWIYEIAKNKCIDAYRRARNTMEVSFDAHDQVGAAEHDRLAEPRAIPDAAVEGKVAFDNLRGAFGGLSPVHHDILVMREFEGLSYREIGERLGMSRGAVESTLFRARKRLGEEYEELVSGKRCLRVQRIVEDTAQRTAGLRDQRRVARHLAHCQPCRRYAHLAGAGDLARPASSAAGRVAAFLPLPAFLRRRWGGEDIGQILSQQAARPAAQWTAHVAQSVDPGTVSGWAKVAAAAATVAIAGGSAIEHRAPAAPVAPSPAGAAVVGHERSPAAQRTANGLPPAATADTHAGSSVAGAPPPATEDGRATADPRSQPGVPHAASADRSKTEAPSDAADPPGTSTALPQAPFGSVGGAAPGTAAPVVDAVDGTTEGGGSSPAASSDAAGGLTPAVGRRPGTVVTPAPGGAANLGRAGPDRDLPGGAPATVDAKGTGAGRGVGGSARDVVADSGGAASDAAPTGPAGSVLPRVPDAVTDPTAATNSLG